MCLLYCYPFFIFFLFFPVPFLHSSANDCVEEGSVVIDGTSNSTLVSPNGVFELGFFTPDENTNKNTRYLGIWYFKQSNPKIIVWVASRDKPLLGPNGSLVIEHRKAKVLDGRGLLYWSTDGGVPVNSDPTFNETSPNEVLHLSTPPLIYPHPPPHARKHPLNNSTRNSTRLCLGDDGNLVLSNDGGGANQLQWQSFDYPTDTFLPGMDVSKGKGNLISWETHNNPAQGNYTFMLEVQGDKNKLVIKKGSLLYWESYITPFVQTPPTLFDLLLNNVSGFEGYNNSRLVLKFNGQIQFWSWKSEAGWSMIFSEPKDRCDLYNTCGNFGSCNSNNGLWCKCLPGFTASSPERWNSGDFSEGCSPRSATCSRNYTQDLFLRMPMMKVSTPDRNETNVGNCTSACLGECSCVAYSCGAANCIGTSNDKMCLIWYYKLTYLQEEYSNGLTIFVRSTPSDIEPISRACWPCGTYSIPYPLSTAASCGDPSYFNFKCNKTTGQIYFSTGNLTYKVSSIDPETRKFTIQARHGNSCGDNCTESVLLLPMDSLPYKCLNDCKAVKGSFIEIGWTPPSEPSCNTSSDCRDWPRTSCKKRGGKMSCICVSRHHWDGKNLNCTKEGTFPKVVISCVASALVIILLSGLFFIYYTWKRRPDDIQGSVEFKEDDNEGIDVPFFDWETILGATNNFLDANKLGTGGFGSVYKGKLPDGLEIAVKRLSSVSVQGLEEFKTEVKLIAKLQHRNLVRLIGYCMKADEKILVYEYMPNGSLDSCLFDEKHSVYLDWKRRFDIILGIARGLVYLHQDSRLRIIHRDLKPSNILLDEELNPKISDFGIARIVGGKETQASTNRVVGTYGYMSPEYASDGIFSVKSDVFSFGVVILETVSGRRNSKIFMFEHGLSLLGHAWKLCIEDNGLELMDPKLNESCFPSEVLKCIHIGLLCVQEDPTDRPTMSAVVHMLSGENTSLPVAKQPAFMNRKPLSENASSSSAMDSSGVHEMMTVSTVGR